MKPIFLAVASLGSLLLAPSLAAAGPRVAVDFLCGVYAHDEITDLVPSDQAPKLDQPVACVLHLTRPGAATYHASVWTVRHLANPQNGDHTEIVTAGVSGDVSHRAGTDGDDLELVMTPGKEDANGDILFEPCESFDVVGRLVGEGSEVWTQTITVEQRCPVAAPPPGPRQIDGRGSGNATADNLLPGTAQPWVSYMLSHGKGFYLTVGGCDYDGVGTSCLAKVFTTRGKVIAQSGADVADPMNEEGTVDYTELDQARADLDTALDHEEGWELVAHDLAAGPVAFDTMNLDWSAKKATLIIRNNGKVWKKVKTPKAPRGMKLNAATIWFMEGGDPMFALLKLTAAETEGIGTQDFFLVVPLPELPQE